MNSPTKISKSSPEIEIRTFTKHASDVSLSNFNIIFYYFNALIPGISSMKSQVESAEYLSDDFFIMLCHSLF